MPVLRVELDRLNDCVDFVGDSDGSIGKGGSGNTAASENFVELFLVGGVISNGSSRVFELMAGQNANDAVVHADDSLLAK